MKKKFYAWFLVPALVATVAAGCSKKDGSSPVKPSEVDATLKAEAPACVSPASNSVADSRTPTLVVTNASGTYAQAAMSYRFQVQDESGRVVEEGIASAGKNGRTSYTVKNRLAIDKPYTWMARSEYQNAYGPWSTKATFMSPKKLDAYMNGNELYEPLMDGAPSEFVHSSGGVDWIEGVGVELLNREAWVQWILPTTLVEGEMSFEAFGIGNSHEDWKTKIMSMEDWGAGNTTNNPYRVTVDKRSEWLGQGSRVRFTMRSRNHDAGEPRGGFQRWDKRQIYGWRFAWKGGTAHLWVYDGGFGGKVKEHLQCEYDAPYDPKRHLVRLGSPFGRADPETLPAVIIRHLWVSSNPRPADLGK